jgi:hypothetical protein
VTYSYVIVQNDIIGFEPSQQAPFVMGDVHNGVTVSFYQSFSFIFLPGIILVAHSFWLIVARCFFYGSSVIIAYCLNKIIKLPIIYHD